MTDAWERFLANMKGEQRSSASAWSEVYQAGDHSLWDHASPSTELIGYILGARLPARARVLDLGCGAGADAIFLAQQNFESHGLDISAQALGLAEQRARNCGVVVQWHECSALSTPFDAGYFDFITDRGCCHHIGGSSGDNMPRKSPKSSSQGACCFCGAAATRATPSSRLTVFHSRKASTRNSSKSDPISRSFTRSIPAASLRPQLRLSAGRRTCAGRSHS